MGHSGIAKLLILVLGLIVLALIGAGIFFVQHDPAEDGQHQFNVGDVEIRTPHVGFACIGVASVVVLTSLKPAWGYLRADVEAQQQGVTHFVHDNSGSLVVQPPRTQGNAKKQATGEGTGDSSDRTVGATFDRATVRAFLVVAIELVSSLVTQIDLTADEFEQELDCKSYRNKYLDQLTKVRNRAQYLARMAWLRFAAEKYAEELSGLWTAVVAADDVLSRQRKDLHETVKKYKNTQGSDGQYESDFRAIAIALHGTIAPLQAAIARGKARVDNEGFSEG